MTTTACDRVRILHKGDGTNTLFTFPFIYLNEGDVYVSLWDDTNLEYVEVPRTDWSFANATTVQFNTAPPATPSPDIFNVKIARLTDRSSMQATFYPGSAIRAEDLNDNFDQLRLAIEEDTCQIYGSIPDLLKGHYWNKDEVGTVNGETVLSTQVATAEWHGAKPDDRIATTSAISERLEPYVQEPEPVVPADEYIGKEWIDTDEIVSRYYVPTLDTWVTVSNTGRPGPRGEVGPATKIWYDELPPTRPTEYPLWFNTARTILYAYYNDGDSEQWVSTSRQGDAGDPGPIGPAGPVGPAGPAGPVGPVGATGGPGTAATIQVGTVTTSASGSPAVVQNTGTANAAVFDFSIPSGPQGDPGVTGPPGAAGATGPQGPKGDPGAGVTIKGSVANAAALPGGAALGDMYITQDDGHGHVWDGAAYQDVGQIRGPQGPDGPAGPQGPQGPQGDPGATGAQGAAGATGAAGIDGAAATIAVGTVTGLAEGATPTITNSGTTAAAIFDFGIPVGATGATGATGPQGIQGDKGDKGDPQVAATTVDVQTGTDNVKYITAKALADADLYLKNSEDDSTTGTLTLNASTSNSFQFPKTRGGHSQVLTSQGDGSVLWQGVTTIGDTPPPGITSGALWYNSALGILYSYNGTAWISV